MSDARGMALDDLARHILPTMLGSMSKREKEEAKKALPKKTKKKAIERPMPEIEDEMEDDEDEKSSPATISIFEMIGSSASEDKFNEDKKKAESPRPKRRIAKKRPVRRK